MSTKITSLVAASVILDADLFVTVTDVATTPDSKKTTIDTLFTGRTHTGTLTLSQSAAANAFEVFDGASEVFTIADGGLIGIGIDAPFNLLTIGAVASVSEIGDAVLGVKTSSAGKAITVQENAGVEGWSIGVNAAGSLEFYDSLAVSPTVTFTDDAGIMLNIDTNSTALLIDSESTTTRVIDIDNPLTTSGWVVQCNDADALTSSGIFNFVSNSVSTGTRTLGFIRNTNTLAVNATVLTLQQDAAQRALFIDHNGATGNAIVIDQDSNDAGDVYAMSITSDNAGVGSPGGIDFSTFTVDEPIFKFTADAVSSLGTLTQQAAVDIGGTTFYIPLYTTGT